MDEIKEDFREIFSFEAIRRELKSLEGMRETIQMQKEQIEVL